MDDLKHHSGFDEEFGFDDSLRKFVIMWYEYVRIYFMYRPKNTARRCFYKHGKIISLFIMYRVRPWKLVKWS